MGLTAEKVAQQWKVTREMQDAFALESHLRAIKAQQAGEFANEITPIDVIERTPNLATGEVSTKTRTVNLDEGPRPDTSIEGLAKLPPVFKKDGTVTAGNASGICDGAAALILVSRQTAEAKGYKPLAKLTAWGIAGCGPTGMGIGPVPAIQKLLAVSGTTLADYDLFDVNEAFAPQFLAVEKELGLPRAQTNVNGGAIALGHPLGASGARITAHLVHELRRRGGKRAIGAACIGGGQGGAMLLETLDPAHVIRGTS